jgi:uncharacterized phage protein (TIGR02220 family)
MSDNLQRLSEIASKFATLQSLPAPDIQWLIAHLEKCYSEQEQNTADLKFTVHEVILYLNKRAGTGYRTDSTVALRLIRARYNENYRLEDFIKVINTKCRQWKGTDMAKYIRPSTLFALGHFEEYLQESKMDGPKEIEFSEKPSI